MNSDSSDRIVQTVCRECREACYMLAHIEKGKVIRLEIDASRPNSRDRLCYKAEFGLERLYSPYRLLYPQKRKGAKGEGRWKRISWDEAANAITDRVLAAKQEYGPESVALVKGFYDRHADFVSRLGNAFGTPNVASIDNTCYIPSAVGRLVTYGFDGRPDLTGSPDCILCWGSGANPKPRLGGRLIVVNSLETEAARSADIWIRPRPGTDLALALGFLNVIINEKLYSREFVDKWTVGFDRLKDHVREYSPEKVAGITLVSAQMIAAGARLFASCPSACLMNGNASEDTRNSTQCARALAIIQAVCGRLDVPGGTVQAEGVLQSEGTSGDVLREKLSPSMEVKKLGSEQGYLPPDNLWYPIASKPVEVHPQHLVDAILTGKPYPVKAVAVFASNPMLSWSNSRRVHEAFKKVDFLAVADMVMTPTAAMADIVLPVASYLESDAVVVSALMGAIYLKAQQKVVKVGECLSNQEIVMSLAAKLGLGEYFWKDMTEYLDDYLKPAGITFRELCRRGSVISTGTRYRKYQEKGFNTPSGKVELFSSLFEKWGYEPLPVYHEPEETPYSSPQILAEYPLILTSEHGFNYVHSQDRYLESARKVKPWPLTVIHPETAAKAGITEGDEVFIENPRGRIKQKATLSMGIDPRVVCVDYGWWFPEKGPSAMFGWNEANLNILTDDSPPYSPEMGSPKMRGFLCRVYKAD